MTDKNVFDFDDYKSYLIAFEQFKKPYLRGFRTRLAEAAGCNNTFVSQALNSTAHFSLEQSLQISRFLKHTTAQEKYFLLLVEWARAGSKNLKDYFFSELTREKETYLNLKNRVREDHTLTFETQAVYFSQWYYAAIHMLITINEFRTPEKIAKHLGLDLRSVETIVDFLLEHKLLILKNGMLHSGPSYLHLERNSPFISRHHSNWRLQAIHSLSSLNDKDIHYSAVSTLSKADVEKLRTKISNWIQEYVKDITNSKEETLMVFNVDFFKLGE